MSDFIFGSIAFFILIAGLWLGYRRWINGRRSNLSLQTRALLGLLVLTLMGGFLGGCFWWLDDVRTFPWDLPPLASRMLAAAGWSFAVATFIVLERPTQCRVRLILLMLSVYLVPLLLTIPLFHLHRFNFTTFIGNAFFIIVFILTFPTLWFLWKQPTELPNDESKGDIPTLWVTRWLVTVVVLTGLWGIALFLTDSGPSSLIWVWPGDLLTSRLISVMLLTICVGSLYTVRNADTARIILAAIMTYGLGVVGANLWNVLVGAPIKVAYVVVFALLSLVSALLLYRARTFAAMSAPTS